MSDPDHHSSIFDLDINVTLKLENVVSSYETEMIALQAGLDSLASMNPSDRKVHVFTDSLSCLQQLATIPYKYRYVNAIVNDVVERLAELTEENTIELHFIPSHTDKIPESDEIDELAKQAEMEGDDLIDHDPLVSSYKLVFKKAEKIKLQKFVQQSVKPSKFANYPDRKPLKDGFLRKQTRNGRLDYKIDSHHSLLNRVRTGHTRARSHLKNIGIDPWTLAGIATDI